MTEQIPANKKAFFSLSLAALGIVYGDIGTSPLYAMRESLADLAINLNDVLGVLSLIFWSLIAVISVKYLCLVFQADNDGEGGILALMALSFRGRTRVKYAFILGIFGAALMLGDGMLTPAISVVSAVEGVIVIAPTLSKFILPVAGTILVAIFVMQSYGTAKIGHLFGPIIIVWFVTIAILGILQIKQNPVVFNAINPYYAFKFFQLNGWRAFHLLGGIFLVITGGEALYADVGHFGKAPIRFCWFLLVLPCLLLNYFGQGAYLLDNPSSISNPFYFSAPTWFGIPLLIIATMATIIASQSVISATFSLTKQAVLLGIYPRLPIVQTSESQRGQIFVPQMNFILGLGTLVLIIIFKSSSAMTHAYGIAVNLVMTLTTLLIIYVARVKWEWSILKIAMVFSTFLAIDLIYLGSNFEKLLTGGWLPISFAFLGSMVMYTWYQGMEHLRAEYFSTKDDMLKIIAQLHDKNYTPLKGTTAIFITDVYDNSGGSFLHFLNLTQTIPENILIVSYKVENVPYIYSTNRFEITQLDKHIYQLILHYGFMDFISVPQALFIVNDRKYLPFRINVETATFLVEIPNIIPTLKNRTMLFFWQEKLFAFLIRNYSANLNIEFYHLPYDRTIALGTYYII